MVTIETISIGMGTKLLNRPPGARQEGVHFGMLPTTIGFTVYRVSASMLDALRMSIKYNYYYLIDIRGRHFYWPRGRTSPLVAAGSAKLSLPVCLVGV
jgi:hypothetical protein